MAEIIQMPKLSDTMTTGTLVRWLKKEGDALKPGDMIAEVETDKATMEVENFMDGVLLKSYIGEGSVVAIGAPICAIGEKGELPPTVDTLQTATHPAKVEDAPTPQILVDNYCEPSNVVHNNSNDTQSSRIRISPLARKLALEKSVDISQLIGTGPQGRIVKLDVLNYKPSKIDLSTKRHHTLQEQKKIPISGMRGIIAKRLVESKTHIPHFYLEIEVNASNLLEAREVLNQQLQKQSLDNKLTVNDFILKGVSIALKEVPAINVSWHDTYIEQHANADIAFGVAIEEGLVTPVIRNSQNKDLIGISLEAKELIQKARNKKLKPEEMTGSTFTVTNLGMYGINKFYGIINPPNSAILSVGSTTKKPIVSDNNTISISQIMIIGLSCDHRAVDGAIGAQFLSSLKKILENPILLFA